MDIPIAPSTSSSSHAGPPPPDPLFGGFFFFSPPLWNDVLCSICINPLPAKEIALLRQFHHNRVSQRGWANYNHWFSRTLLLLRLSQLQTSIFLNIASEYAWTVRIQAGHPMTSFWLMGNSCLWMPWSPNGRERVKHVVVFDVWHEQSKFEQDVLWHLSGWWETLPYGCHMNS